MKIQIISNRWLLLGGLPAAILSTAYFGGIESSQIHMPLPWAGWGALFFVCVSPVASIYGLTFAINAFVTIAKQKSATEKKIHP